MATFSSVTRQHVLQALAEYDARGVDDFREVYGFGPAADYPLIHEDRAYDSRAVLGVAHRFATGRLATSEEFSSSMAAAVAILRKRGFEVTGPPSQRATPARAPRAPRATTAATAATAARVPRPKSAAARAAALRDSPPPTCPTCLMTLPATGVCDDCA